MKRYVIFVGFIALCGSLLVGAGKGNRGNKHPGGGGTCPVVGNVLPMTAACWQESGWNTMSYPLTTTQQVGGVSFGFHPPGAPDSNTRHTNQLTFAGSRSISGIVSATFAANLASCIFWQIESFNSCCPTAPQLACGATNCQSVSPHAGEVRLYFRTSLRYPYDLWWSWASWTIQNGQFTLQVPLIDANWTSHDHSTGMSVVTAAQRVTEIGLSFSGGCFFHHGVQGNGTFTLKDFRLI